MKTVLAPRQALAAPGGLGVLALTGTGAEVMLDRTYVCNHLTLTC